jgi:hypothetical protein
MSVTGQRAPHGEADSTTTAASAIVAADYGEPDWLLAATDVVAEGPGVCEA